MQSGDNDAGNGLQSGTGSGVPHDSQSDHSRDLRILHAMGMSSPDFVYVFDSDQRFIYVNPPLLKLWGRTLDEVVGRNFEDLGYPGELVALHRRQLDEALSGRSVSDRNSYINQQGVEGQYEYTFVPVFGNDGRVETVVGTTRDVTERLQAERRSAEAVSELRESEAQFRHFADAIPQLAWMARADGHIFWYNRRWYEYTGTTSAQMEGWGWQSVHHPDELPKVLKQWGQSLATGEPFEMAFPLRSAAGPFRLFLTRVQPVPNSKGEIVRWFGTNTDIEAQREAAADRDAALKLANEANRTKDEFLAMLGHELRNPLSPIFTALRLLKVRGGMTREYEIIDRQVKHLARLVDDLLDIARITQGKVELRKAPVEVATAVLRGVEMASPMIEQRGHRMKLDVASSGLLVSADPDRLTQVVSNLLTNACKFSDPGTQIGVIAEKDGDVVRIQIRDEGVGIAPEMLDPIFEAFVQRRQAIDRSSGGLGLGLTIVKSLVDLHGGKVFVRSAGLGQGSEFFVELPALESPPDMIAAPNLGEAADEIYKRLRKRILVVDDNRDAAELMADFMKTLGFDVRVAYDPASALDIAADYHPDIALLDIGLPVMDGWELGRCLQKLGTGGGPMLIAVTGYGQQSDRQSSEANGFAGHLIKPVDLDKLTELVCQ